MRLPIKPAVVMASVVLMSADLGTAATANSDAKGIRQPDMSAHVLNTAQQAEIASVVAEIAGLTSHSAAQGLFTTSLGTHEIVTVNVIASGPTSYNYASVEVARVAKRHLTSMLNVVFEYVVPPSDWQVFHMAKDGWNVERVMSSMRCSSLIRAAQVVLAHISSGQPVTKKQLS